MVGLKTKETPPMRRLTLAIATLAIATPAMAQLPSSTYPNGMGGTGTYSPNGLRQRTWDDMGGTETYGPNGLHQRTWDDMGGTDNDGDDQEHVTRPPESTDPNLR